MQNMEQGSCVFHSNKESRDSFCISKDAVLEPRILSFLKEVNTCSFSACLMPALYGKELFLLKDAGVPMSSIFVIEQEPEIHKEIKECKRPDRFLMKDLKTTLIAQTSHVAIQNAYGSNLCPYDLIYLDFYGYPSQKHYFNTFVPIFKLGMLKPKSLFIVTFAKNRTHKSIRLFNQELLSKIQIENPNFVSYLGNSIESGLVTEIILSAAMSGTKYSEGCKIHTESYLSTRKTNKTIIRHKYYTTFIECNL
jgi:hypothetical protein